MDCASLKSTETGHPVSSCGDLCLATRDVGNNSVEQFELFSARKTQASCCIIPLIARSATRRVNANSRILLFENGVMGVEAPTPTPKSLLTDIPRPSSNHGRSVAYLCLRCVRASIRKSRGYMPFPRGRGPDGHLISYDKDKCVSCGECIQLCPTGRPSVQRKASWRRTSLGYR